MRKSFFVLLILLSVVSTAVSRGPVSFVRIKAGGYSIGGQLDELGMGSGFRPAVSVGVLAGGFTYGELTAGYVKIEGGAKTPFESREWRQTDIMLTVGLHKSRGMIHLFAGGGPGLFMSKLELRREPPDEASSIEEKDTAVGMHVAVGAELESRNRLTAGCQYCRTWVKAKYMTEEWENDGETWEFFFKYRL